MIRDLTTLYMIQLSEILDFLKTELFDLILHVDACNKTQNFLAETSGVSVAVQLLQVITELLMTHSQTSEELV